MRDDHVGPRLGINLVEIAPGTATVAMTATAEMVNSVGVIHGGYIFTLADCALALASNSHGVDVVARACSIEFLKPVRCGDHLTARATERHRLARDAIYDVVITRHDEPIAEFRGHTRQFRRHAADAR
jgi:acyl-CoA thioesterase